jgi:hypothetical protein
MGPGIAHNEFLVVVEQFGSAWDRIASSEPPEAIRFLQ